MRRVLLLTALAVACSAAGPSMAQDYRFYGGIAGTERVTPTHTTSWAQTDSGSAAYVLNDQGRAGMTVQCFGTMKALTIGVATSNGITDVLQPNERGRGGALDIYQTTLNGGEVVALGPDDRLLARITLRVQTQASQGPDDPEGGTLLATWLTPAQIRALSAASRIEVRSNRWTLRFVARGSSWAIGNLRNCPMHYPF